MVCLWLPALLTLHAELITTDFQKEGFDLTACNSLTVSSQNLGTMACQKQQCGECDNTCLLQSGNDTNLLQMAVIQPVEVASSASKQRGAPHLPFDHLAVCRADTCLSRSPALLFPDGVQQLLTPWSACRFQAEMQSQQSSASFSHSATLHAEPSLASLHAESSSATFMPSQATPNDASSMQDAAPSHDFHAFYPQPGSAHQSHSKADAYDAHVRPGASSHSGRQQSAQPCAASADKPTAAQTTAASDSSNMAQLKARAAQADRLMQVGCLLIIASPVYAFPLSANKAKTASA